MIFISSCPASVVAAMKQSIPTIPVESFNYINEDDELLLMVEDYMMQTNNKEYSFLDILKDFEFLLKDLPPIDRNNR